jgi:tellurite resistance-related uncharacterized protein
MTKIHCAVPKITTLLIKSRHNTQYAWRKQEMPSIFWLRTSRKKDKFGNLSKMEG